MAIQNKKQLIKEYDQLVVFVLFNLCILASILLDSNQENDILTSALEIVKSVLS